MATPTAVNVACPFCGSAPCETVAKTVWVRGFILMYQISHRPVLGCVPCVRSQLLGEALRSLFLGWFSLTAAIINPFLIIYNLIAGLTVQRNTAGVLDKLRDMGIDAQEQSLDFQTVIYAMTAKLITADDEVDPRELQVAAQLGSELFENFDRAALVKACGTASSLPSMAELGAMMRSVLNSRQKQALFLYLLAVADADKLISAAERTALGHLAATMQVDLEQLAAAE